MKKATRTTASRTKTAAAPAEAPSPSSSPQALLGRRLRHARLAAGMTLLQLARKAECSESLISKVEKGTAAPSLAMLHRLAVALDTNISTLTAPVEPVAGPVIRQGERLVIRGGGIALERVVLPSRNGLLQANIHILEPGAGSDGLIEHTGEEVGLVLEGTVELILGENRYTLHAGDAFSFSSDTPHGYRNAGSTTTRIFWVNTPATY
ncbi:helix-turn-helix domain-containing protein [Burkholderia sp. WAC0059]|uniref:helix-turn-helix domain-containing protein n=1 Tax=Burkholderia sp. WAC0059 TaxID=2066022 RepID=UPI0026978153